MNDKELLELAAKAAGIELEWVDSDGNYWLGNEVPWNPLTDDGDALRLAVKLEIDIEFWGGFDEVRTSQYSSTTETDELSVEEYKDDPYAATRRCIVRAAAEIGRGME
jgi:hypothetical protein